MARASRLSLFGPLCVSFLVPAKVATAAARSHGQGRPSGRRALRASLDGGEHGRTLKTDRATHKPARFTPAALLFLLCLSTTAWFAPVAASRGATPAVTSSGLDNIVDEAASRFGLPTDWIWAVIAAESGGDARAISPKGAIGLMQLMPATWRALSVQYGLGPDPFDRRSNVLAGAAYLRELLDQFGPRGFLAAYNAGPGRYAQARAGGRPLPAETLIYVTKVERSILKGRGGGAMQDAPVVVDWRVSGLFARSVDDQDGAVTGGVFVVTSAQVTP
jgi:soluble lytic murein transglycosylase-like protein